MSKTFNTAGPCRSEDHYMLPPEARLAELRPLIEEKAYFVVHAPRQTGKTTCFESLARNLTAEGKYAAVLTSCKAGESAGSDVEAGVRTVIRALHLDSQEHLPEELRPEPPEVLADVEGFSRLRVYLDRWCRRSPRPVVLFLDEIDALVDETLLSVLDQLHSGYRRRPDSFPHSVALVGLRDVRDYKIRLAGRLRAGSSSPFNIKLESLRLRNFNAEEVAELYGQHTQETGQRFTPEALGSAASFLRRWRRTARLRPASRRLPGLLDRQRRSLSLPRTLFGGRGTARLHGVFAQDHER